MSKIPTPQDLAADKSQNDEAARRARIPTDVTHFTNDIVAAMRKGDTFLSVRTRMPEPEAQTQLYNDFLASGWVLSFHSARTGSSITWKKR